MKYNEILSEFKMDALKNVCQKLGLSGYSKFNKAELVEFISDKTVDESFLRDFFPKLSDNSYKALSCIYEKNADKLDESDVMPLEELGFVYTKGEKYYIAQDISSKFKKLNFSKPVKHTDENGAVKFAQAIANLCGVYRLDKFTELYNKEIGGKYTAEQLEKVLENNGVAVINGYIAENEFEEITDKDECAKRIEELVRKQNGKELAALAYDELIKYSDFEYAENTLQIETLHRFFEHDMHFDKSKSDVLCGIVLRCCKFGSSIDKVEEALKRDCDFKSAKQLEAFSKVYTQVFHSARMWIYSGATPDEMQKSKPLTAKIGRNDPCPCGSGKKYKKCCGK